MKIAFAELEDFLDDFQLLLKSYDPLGVPLEPDLEPDTTDPGCSHVWRNLGVDRDGNTVCQCALCQEISEQ